VARRGGNAADLQLTLMDHVKELRNRGTIVALILLIGSCIAYSFNKHILDIIRAPLASGQELISLNVGGSFAVIMNISIASGFVLATPFLIYHLYAFLRPMMPEKMRQNAVVMFFSSLLLLAGGIAFAYYLALPGALNFLLNFSDGQIIMSQLSVDAYLGFFIKYLLGLALIFQTPLVLMMIHWVTPLSPRGLMKSERWVVVVSFIAAALITPTSDPINLMMVALPTIAVYQIGVIVIIFGTYRNKRLAKKLEIRTQRQEIAAVKHAISERKKLNVGPGRLVAVASTHQPQQHRPVRTTDMVARPALSPIHVPAKKPAVKPASPIAAAAPAPVKMMSADVFLPETRKKAPELTTVYRTATPAVVRPADRSAQTYRNRKTIDGFARRPATIAVALAPASKPEAAQYPMQATMPAQPVSGGHTRMSVDGMLPVMTAS